MNSPFRIVSVYSVVSLIPVVCLFPLGEQTSTWFSTTLYAAVAVIYSHIYIIYIYSFSLIFFFISLCFSSDNCLCVVHFLGRKITKIKLTKWPLFLLGDTVHHHSSWSLFLSLSRDRKRDQVLLFPDLVAIARSIICRIELDVNQGHLRFPSILTRIVQLPPYRHTTIVCQFPESISAANIFRFRSVYMVLEPFLETTPGRSRHQPSLSGGKANRSPT